MIERAELTKVWPNQTRSPSRAVPFTTLVPFVVFYTAWEVLLGIGTGVLVDDVKRASGGGKGDGGKPGRRVHRQRSRPRPRSVCQHRRHRVDNRNDCGRSCPPASGRRAACGDDLARPIGDHHQRPPTALRTRRPGRLHCRRLALRAQPSGSPHSGAGVIPPLRGVLICRYSRIHDDGHEVRARGEAVLS